MARLTSVLKATTGVLAATSHRVAGQVYTGSSGVYTVTQDTGGDIALASKHFTWPDLPYQADTGNGPRGTQQGYNICNSTTQNQDSMCQTGYLNALDDFCLWGSPITNETVADVEEEMVAYCTKKKYGSRLLTQGAITGAQFIRTPDYVEIVGFIDQTALNLTSDDTGGEEDPHGADQRGNPLGSLMYSSAFNNASTGSSYTQVIEWSYFVGSGIFCFKACDPAGPRAAELCQHTYDRVGCTYNDPASYATINGTFQSCQGDDQLPVGEYVSDGRTVTWQQPAESLGAITSIPYTPSVPATSSCTTYTSSAIFTELLTVATPSSSSSSSSASSTAGSSSGGSSGGSGGSGSGGSSASRSGSGSSPSSTGGSSSSGGSSAAPGTGGMRAGAVVTVVIAAGISFGIAMIA